MIKSKLTWFFGAVLLAVLFIFLLYVKPALAQTKGVKPDQGFKQVPADAAQPGRAVSATSPQVKNQNSATSLPSIVCAPGTWNTSTTGPAARYRGGAVSDGTYVYVFGGGDSVGGYYNDLWRWDPGTETWTQLANMPTGKQNMQGAYWNGKIYVPGGYNGVHITENAIYDIATNTWTTGAPLPAAQTGTNVAYNGKIYNFGGNPGPQTTTAIYDIASNSWSTGAPMPVATTYGRAAAAGPYAYYVGGITAVTTNAVYRYDFAANSWTTMSPLQTARTSEELMTSSDGSKLFAVMGGDSTFFTGVPLAQSVEIYDIAANSWSYSDPVVTKAAAPAGGLAGSKAMVQGGVDNVTYYNTVQVSVVTPCGFSVATANPACSSIIFSQPTDFVVNLTDPVDPATVQASDFTVNGIAANSFALSNGNATITFSYNSTPVTTQGVQTMHIDAGAFNRSSDNSPNFDFTCTFRFDAVLLQVTTTVPAVGGTFTPPAPGTYQYDVNFNEAVDPASVQTSDLTVSGNSGPSVSGVSVLAGNMTVRFMVHMNFGGALTANIAAGAITDQFGNSGAAFSGNYTVGGCPPQNHYDIAQIGDSIVAGTTDTGNHVDDGTTNVVLPFTYTLYDQTYTSVNVDSNGTLQFVSPASVFTNTCLPFASHTYVVLPYWDDQRTDAQSGCSAFPGGVCGIFTSVTGSAPNRIFNIEWRTVYFAAPTTTANFEVRLYEGQSHFDVIYGSTSLGNTSSTAGVQKDAATLDQYFCNGSGGAASGGQSYILQSCTAPAVSSAVSRKTHGAAGDFDVNLPLTGAPGVECRSNSATNDYTMMVTFVSPVTVNGSPQADVTLGAGTVGSGGVSNGGAVTISGNTVTIPLTNVTNAQTINVTLHSVNGVSDVVIPMSVLIGDTNGNGGVNAGDVSQTKGQSGIAVGAGNFRNDVNASGATVNAGDVALVKSKSGTVLPP